MKGLQVGDEFCRVTVNGMDVIAGQVLGDIQAANCLADRIDPFGAAALYRFAPERT